MRLLRFLATLALLPLRSTALSPQCRASSSSLWQWKVEEEAILSAPNLLNLEDRTDLSCSASSLLDDPLVLSVRGGDKSSNNSVVQGTKTSLATTREYWGNAFTQLRRTVTKPFTSIRKPSFLLSDQEKKELDLIDKLQTTPIQHVQIVPNSTILPPRVVQMAVQRSGLLGKPLQTRAVQDVARSLKQWYERRGYILHSMTGATLQVDTQTAELTVQEPKCSTTAPVKMVFCKEMIIDPDDGSLLTMRQYKQKMNALADTTTRRASLLTKTRMDRSKLNTTFVPTDTGGRTNPKRMAAALGLQPGKSFCWNPTKWNSILQSGIFKSALRATPERLPDGSVQLQLVVQEAPSRNLEYGLSKSLYTDAWEGEVDFRHGNVLGGGESLGVSIKRGTHDAEPSVRIQYEDDHFGASNSGGYNVQVFSDYIGEHLDDDGSGSTTTVVDDYDHDELLDRKGASINIRNLLTTLPVSNSASACLERTSTKGGRHESVASTTLHWGPVRQTLPLQARTSLFGKITAGARVAAAAAGSKKSAILQNHELLPFTAISATTRQEFPLTTSNNRPLVLALSHSATTSTRHLPRHEATAQGNACKIRGYNNPRVMPKSERASSFLVGMTELRIPVSLADATVVLFGDWCLSQERIKSAVSRKTSVGVGLRKSFQGLPLKYDVTYTGDKVGAMFGLGPDFGA